MDLALRRDRESLWAVGPGSGVASGSGVGPASGVAVGVGVGPASGVTVGVGSQRGGLRRCSSVSTGCVEDTRIADVIELSHVGGARRRPSRRRDHRRHRPPRSLDTVSQGRGRG